LHKLRQDHEVDELDVEEEGREFLILKPEAALTLDRDGFLKLFRAADSGKKNGQPSLHIKTMVSGMGVFPVAENPSSITSQLTSTTPATTSQGDSTGGGIRGYDHVIKKWRY